MKPNQGLSQPISIVKASGERVPFSHQKLLRSFIKSGVSEEIAKDILRELEPHWQEGMSTKQIHKIAMRLLKKHSKTTASRYHLKRAIMELGPSGFPFEQLVAGVLNAQGYETTVGQIVQGKCVKHEIDVVAEKGDQHFMIECKFHSLAGKVCDVKIPLYIQSRFKDIEASWVQLPGHNIKLHQGWVVTNTRFTSDAITYGKCVGLNLVGWDYPFNGGLNEQIERGGLYPVTCLTSLTKYEKHKLISANKVLCKDICEHPDLLTNIGIRAERVTRIVEEGVRLCNKLIASGKHHPSHT